MFGPFFPFFFPPFFLPTRSGSPARLPACQPSVSCFCLLQYCLQVASFSSKQDNLVNARRTRSSHMPLFPFLAPTVYLVYIYVWHKETDPVEIVSWLFRKFHHRVCLLCAGRVVYDGALFLDLRVVACFGLMSTVEKMTVERLPPGVVSRVLGGVYHTSHVVGVTSCVVVLKPVQSTVFMLSTILPPRSMIRYAVQVATYSCQSDKVVNSGEGGFLTTNDEELFSKAIFMSGCYERRYREGKR